MSIFSVFFRGIAFLRATITRMLAWVARMGWLKAGSIALVGGVVLLVGGHFFLSQAAPETPEVHTPSVEVKSVADLSAETVPLSVAGTVTSRSEATVRAEKSGQITHLYRALGDSVGAGSIVAEFEDASERAALTQAQGAVDAATANLAKVQKGTRTEQLAILQAALEGAQSGAVNTLLSAYASVDNAVRGTADTFFSNPEGTVPHFNVSVSNSQLKTAVETERSSLAGVLQRESAKSGTLSASDDLDAELATAQTEVRAVRDFLDDIIAALNAGIPDPNSYSATTIAAYITSATAARTAINTSLSSITTSRQSLQTAQKNEEQGVTGAQPEDIAAAQAALTQAQGSLAAARANLEHSIIRAPISGTINSLSLKAGDYTTLGTPVLTVANNGALEVLAYVTESDAKDIATGQPVTFDGGASGVVTRIAPALDPLTKKIEVRIGISGQSNTLVNGQSVLAEITRLTKKTGATARITIPISAIKVEAEKVSVFTVNTDNTLVSHEVVLGSLLGDRVVITSGLTGDMEIVTDARGLREGEVVDVR